MAIDAGTILAHIDMDAAGFMGAMDGAAERLTAFAQGELPAAVAAATGVLAEKMNGETGATVSAAWMQGVCAGVEAMRGALEGCAADAAQGGVNAAGAQMNEAAGAPIGEALVEGMADGVSGASGELEGSARAAAGDAVAAAASEMSEGRGHEIGAAMVAGMAQGVQSGAGGLYAAVSSVAARAVSRAKSALSIHSPSQVFADEVGAWIPSGIGEGISEHAQDALRPIEDVKKSMLTAMDAMRRGEHAVYAQAPAAPVSWDGAVGANVHIEVTGDWTVREERDRDEIIQALGERIGEELRRR